MNGKLHMTNHEFSSLPVRQSLTIVGVGTAGRQTLSEETLALINSADELWGSPRLLEMFPETTHPVTLEHELTAQLKTLAERSPNRKIVLLASGDPGFYGLGSKLRKMLPDEKLQIIPQPSTIQEAFARADLSLEGAFFLSAHQDIPTELHGALRRYARIGLLTGPKALPQRIAQRVLSYGLNDIRVVVCSNMGLSDEAFFNGTLEECAAREFSALSVILLIEPDNWQPEALDICRPDEAYAFCNGLITKHDIRALALQRLKLRETDVFWDIGAGSGALSVEAAEHAWNGRVYAIERNTDCLGLISENRNRFGVDNLEIISGSAPEALANLPTPDAVFIGGSGGCLEAILNALETTGKKPLRLVMSFVLLEHVCSALLWFRTQGIEPELVQIAISNSSLLAGNTRLVPQNPVFLLSGTLTERNR